MTRARRALDGLDEDIRDHIERETRTTSTAAMAPDEARRQRALKFGNVALAKATPAPSGDGRAEQLAQDARMRSPAPPAAGLRAALGPDTGARCRRRRRRLRGGAARC